MSVIFNESNNYIWNIHDERDCIGEGASGRVYRGICKKNGVEVAIKTLKTLNPRSQEIKMLQNLRHPNIIKLHDVETALSGSKKVMILELCNAGSLMNFLNEPENTNGLLDSEFILVSQHLSSGLEYLRRHNIIHRDVKPDNIMRHINIDGSTTYKLADFGSARVLPEGENYHSLHGTEPYLNPDIYQVSFFQGSQYKKSFGANTDLWSIGVTLYQIATGTLPFPHRNRRLTLNIYKKMRQTEGIIAAVHNKNSEEMTFYKTLPHTSRLSLGLKKLVTPIIAGLFIQESERQWSFSQYYEQILNLVSKRVINVFYLNKMQMLKIYMKSDETFNDFKRHVYEQSNVSEIHQYFLYKHTLIVNNFRDFYTTGPDCVFLFDEKTTNLEAKSNIEISEENLTDFKTKFMDPAIGYNFAGNVYRELCGYKNIMDYQSMVYKSVDVFMKNFDHFCRDTIREHRLLRDYTSELYSDLIMRFKVLEKLQDTDNLRQISITQIQTATDSFVSETNELFATLEAAEMDFKPHTSHDSYMGTVVKELLKLKHRIQDLSNFGNDKTVYHYEKLKIVNSVEKILKILSQVMRPNFEIFMQESQNWYKTDFFSRLRMLTKSINQINSYKSCLETFQQEINTRNTDILKAQRNVCYDPWEELIRFIKNYRQASVNTELLLNENAEGIKKMDELISSLRTILSTATDVLEEIEQCNLFSLK